MVSWYETEGRQPWFISGIHLHLFCVLFYDSVGIRTTYDQMPDDEMEESEKGSTLFMGDMGESALHEEERNCQTKKIKIWSWVPQGTRHQNELAD
jgi:hypothetical protein